MKSLDLTEEYLQIIKRIKQDNLHTGNGTGPGTQKYSMIVTLFTVSVLTALTADHMAEAQVTLSEGCAHSRS